MKIKKFKRISNTKFIFNNSKYVYNRDIFWNENLIELMQIIFKGKNFEEFVDFENADNLQINSKTKIVLIEPFLDFKKKLFSTSKSIFSELVFKILEFEKIKNEILNSVEHILSKFNISSEIEVFNNYRNDIYNSCGLNIDIAFDINISRILSENITTIFNKNNVVIDENNIKNIDVKKIYFKTIEWISKYLDDDYFIVFNDIFLGLNISEMLELQKEISTIKNKIVITSFMPNIIDEISDEIVIIHNDDVYDFYELSNPENDINSFFINENFINLKFNLISKILYNYNYLIEDVSLFLDNKLLDLWTAFLNRI